MVDVITTLWLLSILIAFFGCIPYLIWIIKTIKKRDFKKVRNQVLAPIVFYIALNGLSIIVNKIDYKLYLKNVFDTSVSFDDPIYSYESERAFNGDGYSLTVHTLPKEIEERFKNFDQKLKSSYPIKPAYRDKWETIHWQKAPITDKFTPYFNFALSEPYGKKKKLKEHLKSISSAIKGPNVYYSFFYYDHSKDFPGNIDLFIIDLKNKMVYLINHNM